MRECDRTTIGDIGIPGLILMENASRAVAIEALEMLGDNPGGKEAWVLCGKGNNGGDGFAVARHLRNAGVITNVTFMGAVSDLSGDAKFNCDLYLRLGGVVAEVNHTEDIQLPTNPPHIVIDALLGTGFEGKVKGKYADAIEVINNLDAPIIAVDIPSGVVGDTGAVNGLAVQADRTVTFGLLKRGLMLPPGRETAGEVIVADIGIPPQVISQQNINLFLVGKEDVRRNMPRRSPTAHKGNAGHILMIAGSCGLTGAAAMAAESAMRTGAGLVVVGVPRSLNPILEVKLNESMTLPLPETDTGAISSKAYKDIIPRIEWAHTVVIGPGLGRDPDTGALLRRLLPVIDKPLVIDADGLNQLADNSDLLEMLPPSTVLTPHPGEFARLTGLSVTEILANRLTMTEKCAVKWNVNVVLKGSPTVTALPNGRILLNSTGNSGMATGGSGDVLTGVIAGLIAQGVSPDDAAWMGVYIHGAAGDQAAENKGQLGMVAGDIIDYLPETLIELA